MHHQTLATTATTYARHIAQRSEQRTSGATSGRPATTHDNTRVSGFLADYYSASDLCSEYRQIDDIFSGVLELKTEGCTSTRALSRQGLFHILQWCPTISVAAVNRATNGRYAYRSLAGYAALARVASRAIERFISSLPAGAPRRTVKQCQQGLDAPYHAELRALGLI